MSSALRDTLSALTDLKNDLLDYGAELLPSGAWVQSKVLRDDPTYVAAVWAGAHNADQANMHWLTDESTLDVTLLTDVDSTIGIETDDPRLLVSVVQMVVGWEKTSVSVDCP